MKLAAIDPGLSGGICLSDDSVHAMPIKVITDKPARYTLDLKNGKKQFYKSGPNKGQPKRKLHTPAKTHRELDCKSISTLLTNHTHLIIETPGSSRGNSARVTATTQRNYGKLLAIAELLNLEVIPVTPSKWKADLSLSKDKQESLTLAETLLNTTFKKSEDGLAEAFLIKHWYQNKKNS